MTARSAARPFGSTGEGNCLTRAPLVSFNTYGLKHVCPRFREALKAVHVPCHRGRVDKGVTSGRPKGSSSTARLTRSTDRFEAVVFAVHRCGFVARCA